MYRKSHVIIISFFIAFQISLLIFTEIKFFEDDEWTFYFAAENYSKGRFSITGEEYLAQQAIARVRSEKYNSDNFTQYRQRKDGFWVSEKPPGYPLILSVFHYHSIPKLPNILLFIAMGYAFYFIKNDYLSVRERFYTSVLVMTCPLVLIASSRFYMVDFFSFSLSGLGFATFLGAVSLYKNRLYNILLGFASGIFISLSSFSRITGYGNAIFIAVFILLFIRKAGRKRIITILIFFIIGVMVFLIPNAVYNYRVLGGVFQNSYFIGDMPLKIPKNCFSFQYLFSGEPPHPFFYVFRNIITSPQIIMVAMPAILFMFPGICTFFRKKDKRIMLFLLLVFGAIFGLYLQFYRVSTVNYLWNARPYLQGFFPVAVFSGVFLSRLRRDYRVIILITLIFIGYGLFFDFLYNNNQDPYYLGIKNLWHIDQRTRTNDN